MQYKIYGKKAAAVAQKYFQALQTSNFTEISKLVHDSLIYMDGDYIIANSIESYYVFFQWDSAFIPEYKVLDENEINDSIMEYTVSKRCKRIDYLHDTEIVHKLDIHVKNNRIYQIKIKEHLVFNSEKWQQRRDSLTAFINKNYPELNGFEIDITLPGAHNYLKALELFK